MSGSLRRFLGDRSRNRYDAGSGRRELSRIFDWYKADFEKGGRGFASVPQFLARYADFVADEAVVTRSCGAGSCRSGISTTTGR